ncbi:MAG: YggT family protein [Deltaproteobacteria bacterium]|nr:YggT family protein [Deltaproteobacteria bacterium]
MGLVLMLLQVLTALVLVDAVLSWVMPPDRFPRSLTTRITDPIYAPIRKVLNPSKTGIDLSPMVLIVLIQLVRGMLVRGF